VSTPDIRLSVAIMTHPRRLHMAERLRDRHPELGARIVVDTGQPGGPGVLGSLRSARQAWAAVHPDATHHLVLQDDVWLPDGLERHLYPLIASRPGGALSLFAEWGAWTAAVVRLAALTGAGWAEVVDMYVPTQAIVLPAALARSADGRFAAALEQRAPEADDVVLMGHLRHEGVVPHVCVPNLVEHLDAPSIVGNDDYGLRRSVCCLRGTGVAAGAVARAVTDVDTVPGAGWWDGFAMFRLRAPEERVGWRKVPAVPALAPLGLTRASLNEYCRVAVDAAGGPAVREAVSEILVFHVWLAAFCLGLRAAEIAAGPRPDGSSTLDTTSPVARRALATLAPGAVRRFVPGPQLPHIAALLRPVVHAGIALGAEVCASGTADPRRLPTGRTPV
jgi:hypothetical protein